MRIKLPTRADYNLGPIHKIQSRPVIRCALGVGFVPHSDQNAVSEEHGALDSLTPDVLDPEHQAQAYFFGQSGVISKSSPTSKKCFNTPALDDLFVSRPHKPVLNLELPEEALPASDPRCEKDNHFLGRLRDVTIFSEEHAVPKSHSNFKFKNPFNASPTLDQEIIPDTPLAAAPPNFQPKPHSRDDNDNWVMVDRERDRDDEWLMVQKDDEEF